MCEKYPDRVPIICERHQRCTFPSWMHWTLFLSTEGYRGGLRYKQTINRWRTWVECMVRAAFHFLDLHATLGESALSVLLWFVFGRFATTSDTFLLTHNFFLEEDCAGSLCPPTRTGCHREHCTPDHGCTSRCILC